MVESMVMLVEDNEDDEYLALRVLTKHGFGSVVVARDGGEALDLLLGAGAGPLPRFVLIDLKLHKLGGIDVIRALRGSERTRELPVIVISSSRDERDMEICYGLGVVACLSKPLRSDQFLAAAEEIPA